MQSVLPDIEIMNINDIHINPDNPRIIRDDKFLKLIESIENFPQMLYIRPIIIDAHNRILGGNQRFLACKELKYTEVPVIRALELTEEQYKEFVLKDNYSSGEWDIDKLINEWDHSFLDMIGINANKLIDNMNNPSDRQGLDETKLDNMFKIEVSCQNETEQGKLYNELIDRGHTCKLLTL